MWLRILAWPFALLLEIVLIAILSLGSLLLSLWMSLARKRDIEGESASLVQSKGV